MLRRPEHPSLRAGHAGFLAAVLRDDAFARHGILYTAERVRGFRLHWVVVDPRRHTMYAWRKAVPSYPVAARSLGASVVTSGPFTNHAGGSPVRATVKVVLDVLPALASHRAWRESSDRYYRARAPLGHVLGEREGICEESVDRPRLHYFGRRAGSTFDDYEIGQGDPTGMTEVVGGLFRAVTAYRPYTVDRFLRVGIWGLAPLTGGPVAFGPDVDLAVERGCRGLVVFAAGRVNTRYLAELLVAVGVKDAVQVDGGDSLLLGRGRELRIGRLMPEWKRMLQCWGIQFQPAP